MDLKITAIQGDNMYRLPRQWINDMLDRGLPVQCAVSATNSTYYCYLTTSGMVCRAEFGYVEDVEPDDNSFETIDISKISFSSIGRLNRALGKLSEQLI